MTYVHVPSQRLCHIMRFFEQDYLVFNDNQQTVMLSEEGLYSKHTLSRLIGKYGEMK